jgi:predicted MFS family arabinose efflux permease
MLMTRTVPARCIALLAFAAGATVANLYYSQPLLAEIAAELGVSPGAASAISTATQLGYAAGLLLLVPLGDAVERRRLLVTTTAAITLALLLVALSHSLAALLASSAILGCATIVPQLVVPFAAHLAPPEQRGRVIGSVMSGVLIGVILSRSVSGFLAGTIGWRTTYVAAAAAMAVLAVLLRFELPLAPPEVDLRYGELLRSLGALIRTEPLLRRHALIGAFGFAAFSIFWTSLAFHLQSLSPAYGTKTVGAFGIVGVTGALIAPLAGRLADRAGSRALNVAGLALMSVAFALMSSAGASLVVLAIGVIFLDAGEQTSHIANQARIFSLDAALRNRLNAVYMVAFFIGGAIGSSVAGYAWQHGGWTAVCVAGILCSIAGGIAAAKR